MSERFGDHSFGAAWRTVHEQTLGWVDTEAEESLWSCEWPFDGLAQFALEFMLASNVFPSHLIKKSNVKA